MSRESLPVSRILPKDAVELLLAACRQKREFRSDYIDRAVDLIRKRYPQFFRRA